MPLIDLLERGYFPKELPTQFCSTSFAQVVCSSNTLPTDFVPASRNDYNKLKLAKAAKYSHARGGLLRRPLRICNPLAYYRLARELDQEWSMLAPSLQGTPLSATNPVSTSSGRAIQGSKPQSMRPSLAIETRLNNRFILITDISRFYQSIYTHSIAWAIHTKPVAKQNRRMNYIGNRIDALVRSGQDGQTVGIPIGPDTSLILAEILMQACDRELLSVLPNIRGYRFIDDYELGFRTRNEAENAFHILESILSGYELALNPRKTMIEELPFRLEASWAAPIRSFTIRSKPCGQATDLIAYFDLASELDKKYPDEAVLQFAVGRLRSIEVAPENWRLFQLLLLGLVVPDPALLPFVLEAINSRANKGAIPAYDEIGEALNTIILDHSVLGHSSEIVWSLWASIALNIKLSEAVSGALSICDDSCVALCALHCQSCGLLKGQLDTTLWSSYMTTSALYEEHWLLSYEANIKNWLPSNGRRDHVNADPNFSFLKTNGVSFYDAQRVMPATQTSALPVPQPTIPPIFYAGASGGYIQNDENKTEDERVY